MKSALSSCESTSAAVPASENFVDLIYRAVQRSYNGPVGGQFMQGWKAEEA